MVRGSLALLAIVAFTSVAFIRRVSCQDWPWSQPTTCNMNTKNCWNPCARYNMNCCFCDNAHSLYITACSCCPKDHICCPATMYSKWMGSSCCPEGSKCQSDGTCLVPKKQIPSSLVADHKCRQTTEVTVTVDNAYYMYCDGKQIETIRYPKVWELTDKVYITPENCSLLAIWGENYVQEAGILLSSNDDSIISDYTWRCYSDVPVDDEFTWYKPDYDRTKWGYAYEGHRNVHGAGTHRQVPGISENARWIWCNPDGKNVPWKKYCFCVYEFKY